jgi:hypothetical protein
MNFDLKLRIPDYLLADMIEQCKLTSAPEGEIRCGKAGVKDGACPEETESNYVPDTD